MSFRQIREFVLADAASLEEGGIDGLMIENFGDVPFYPSRVPAHTIAFLTVLAYEVRTRHALPLGVNVLRNDGLAAIAIAAAVDAQYVRVNVYTGARLADQGILQGEAHEITRYRQTLGATVQIWADVAVKHSSGLAGRPLDEDVEDMIERGLADAIIVSGTATGKDTSIADLVAAKRGAGKAPVFVGSGANETTIARLLQECDGAIIGSALKRDGRVSAPVDPDRVRALVAQAKMSAG
jgi:membrane complex biogenesis BtpA family protein